MAVIKTKVMYVWRISMKIKSHMFLIKKHNLFLIFFLCQLSSFLTAHKPNTIVATINVGVTPAGIAFTPNGKYAYVANANNYGNAGHDAVGQDNISVIDVSKNLVVKTIYDASLNQPQTVTINPAGTKAYACNSNSSDVTVIDVATNTVTAVISGFDGPDDMVINAAGTVGYVSNYGGPGGLGSGNGHTVNVVDLVNNVISGTIDLAPNIAPAALAMTPDGAYVYTVNYMNGNPNTGTLNIIRTSDNTLLPTVITGFSGPFDMAISPDGKFGYVTNFGSNNFYPYGTTLSVVNLSSNTIVATIPLGIQPAGVAVTADSSRAYVTIYNTLYNDPAFSALVYGQGIVNVVDLSNNTVLPISIAVDQSPGAVVISPNGAYAYISNYSSNTISVIALQSFQIAAQGCRKQNRYLTHIDFINTLTWTVSGGALPVAYFIYRDAELTDLAGTVLAGQPLEFQEHNVNPNINYTYYIVGVNQVGTLSDPVTVIVNQNC